MAKATRPRAEIEKDIEVAQQEVWNLEEQLDEAEDQLEELEAELESTPMEGVDEELWYAARDARQLSLELTLARGRTQ
jgi:chromosome segregation ATPase